MQCRGVSSSFGLHMLHMLHQAFRVSPRSPASVSARVATTSEPPSGPVRTVGRAWTSALLSRTNGRCQWVSCSLWTDYALCGCSKLRTRGVPKPPRGAVARPRYRQNEGASLKGRRRTCTGWRDVRHCQLPPIHGADVRHRLCTSDTQDTSRMTVYPRHRQMRGPLPQPAQRAAHSGGPDAS